MQLEGEQRKRHQEEIKMRRIMQHTFEQLQLQKIEEDLQLMYDINNLKEIYQFLDEKTYAEIEYKPGLSQQEVEKAQAKKLYNKMELIYNYLGLIAINKKDPVLKKTRFSPFPSDQYFRVFHDLESLNTIKSHVQKATQDQTIADCLDSLRKYMKQWPKREEVMQRAKQQYEKINKKQSIEKEKQSIEGQFGIKPSKCETMTADQFQKDIIYTVNELQISWDTLLNSDEENEVTIAQCSISQEQPQLSFMDRLQQLQRQLTEEQKIHDRDNKLQKTISDQLFY